MYLENFQFPIENKRAYPYDLLAQKGLEHVNFAPITIFYGNNGSGKSTLLNIIAKSIGIHDKTLGNTNEYFNGYARKCTYTVGEKGIPNDSTMIRSEDIMHYIANIRKRNADIDKLVQGWLLKGMPQSMRGTLRGRMQVQEEMENVFEHGGDSFHSVMVGKLMEKTDEQSNGETAINYFKDRLMPDNLYLLDEPENSMAPEFQQDLADFICILTYRLKCQFIIASHSPFMLSIPDARIYDLDHSPARQREWYELENMKTYYQLFHRFSDKFEK